jgi:hypothetical protein
MSEIDRGSDRAYYTNRAAQERLAAERTSNPDARRVHLELAQRYEAIVRPLADAA